MSDASIIIEQFTFNKQAKRGEKIFSISGRPGGITAFLLNLAGLSRKSYIDVTHEEIRFEFVNLSGVVAIVCPLDSITCSACGVQRPGWALTFGAILAIAGIPLGIATMGPGFIASIVGALMLVYFFISKSLILTFSTGDMLDTHGLAFNSGVVNGVKIDKEKLLEIVQHINLAIIRTHGANIQRKARATDTALLPTVENGDEAQPSAPPAHDRQPRNMSAFQPAPLAEDWQNSGAPNRNGNGSTPPAAAPASPFVADDDWLNTDDDRFAEPAPPGQRAVERAAPAQPEAPRIPSGTGMLANSPVKPLLKQFADAYRAGDFQKAQSYLLKAEMLDPTNPDVQRGMQLIQDALKKRR